MKNCIYGTIGVIKTNIELKIQKNKKDMSRYIYVFIYLTEQQRAMDRSHSQ